MSAYIYTYSGENFRVQVSRCVLTPKEVAVYFTKLNLTTFEVEEIGFNMTDAERQTFFATLAAGPLGGELLSAIIDWAAESAKDRIVLNDMTPPQDYISPEWTKI